MKTIGEILDFFRENDCKVIDFDMYGKEITFDIWSNVAKTHIIQNANEFQLREFYNKINN
jgi:hypothetical protein